MDTAVRVVRAACSCAAAVLLALACNGCDNAVTQAAEHVSKGDKLLTAGDLPRARVELKTALRLDPHSAEGHYLAGLLAEREERWVDAIGQYTEVVDKAPDYRDAYIRLARLALWTQSPDKALELAEQALQHAPGNPQALAARGAAQVQLGDMEAATRDAEAALAADPGDEYALALMASLDARRGDVAAAIGLLEEGARRNPTSISVRTILAQLQVQDGRRAQAAATMREIIALAPADPKHRARLAALYAQSGDVDAAEGVLRQAVVDLPEDPSAKLMLVQLLQHRRDPRAAERELLGFVSAQPQDYELRFALAALHEQDGKVDAAREIYEQILAQDADGAQGLNARDALARLDLQAGQTAAAGKQLEAVLAANPHDRKALLLRATMSLGIGDADAAVADLRAALRSAPDSVDLLRLLGRAYAQRNETALGLEALQRAVELAPQDLDLRLELARLAVQGGEYAAAKEHLNTYLAQRPDDPAALELQVRVLVSDGAWTAAEPVAERVRTLQPEQPLGYYLCGVIARARDDEAAAQAYFVQALERAPTAIEPLSALVRGYVTAGQPQRAIERLRQVLQLDPRHVVAHNLLGDVLLQQRQLDDAREQYAQAVRLQPDWWMPYRGLAAVALAAGRQEAAIAAYQQGIDATASADLVTDLALLRERRGEHAAAIDAYEELLRHNPNEERAANNLAMLLVSNRADKASLERAWQLAARFTTSSNPAYLDTAGWVLVKRGEVGPALRLLEQAVQAAPDAPTLRYHLGVAYQASGNLQRALRELDRALAPNTEFPSRAAAQSARDALATALAPAARAERG